MSTNSKIQWTQATWNPVSGCTRVSAGCDHCYAVNQTFRLERMGQAEKYGGLTVLNPRGERHFNGIVRCHEDALQIPLRRKKPTVYFVNSMSDLFHRDVPFEFIDKVFAVMALCPRHTFQILTKRPERMAEYLQDDRWISIRRAIEAMKSSGEEDERLKDPPRSADDLFRNYEKWPMPNIWLGTSVENQAAADERIPHLLRCPAGIRFLSCEPLLGPIDLISPIVDQANDDDWYEAHEWGGECTLCGGGGFREYNDAPEEWGEDCPSEENHLIPCRGCDELLIEKRLHIVREKYAKNFWVIAGGESGAGARRCNIQWIRSIVRQCRMSGVACFVKQIGAKPFEYYEGKFVERKFRDSKGGDMNEWPEELEDLRVRQMPEAK